ncbi:MAG: C40 family peptidase [Chitinophagaceae bacterium]|nr:C40 family peptidase [Chitinophagaceae bacterium]
MIRNFLSAFTCIAILVSCSNTRPPVAKAAPRQVNTPNTPEAKKNDIKFLDEITANPHLSEAIPDVEAEKKPATVTSSRVLGPSGSSSNVSALQLKYAQLLGTDPTTIEATDLLKSVDHWYGTRYKMGGTSKSGIDCSAFVQAVYMAAFSLMVPRTAYEQFRVTNRISAVEMKEGDLVFFNTTGGVSHVGIYLRNNKFIHASSSRGVTVSDLFDPYYLKRFLGVGRLEKPLGTR